MDGQDSHNRVNRAKCEDAEGGAYAAEYSSYQEFKVSVKMKY